MIIELKSIAKRSSRARFPGCSRLVTTALAAALLAVPTLADGVTNTPDYINVPGTDTKLRIYGFVQVYATEYLNVSEFNNGGIFDNYTSGTSAQSPRDQLNLTARTSRFGFATITPTSTFGDVTTMVELDFANVFPASSGTSNYDQAVPRIRQAVITANHWTVGYTWSNWIDRDAGAETVDFAGPMGAAPYDTPRYTQIKYKIPFNKQLDLTLSLEENPNDGPQGFNSYAKGSPYTGTIIGNPGTGAMSDIRYPTLVAAFTYADSWGHLGLRGMEQHWGAYQPAIGGGAPVAAASVGTWAGAVQLSGNLKVGKDNFVATVYTGQGLGSYGTDNSFDFVADPGHNQIKTTTSTGWVAGYTHVWSPAFRSNLVASGLYYTRDAAAAVTIAEGGSAALAASKSAGDYKNATYYAVNSFYKFSKTLELGAEFFTANVQNQGDSITDGSGNPTDRMRVNAFDLSLTATF